MTKMTLILTLATACCGPLLAQKGKFSVYGQNIEDRASTRLGYWRTDANAGIGEVVVSYGRPVWKPEYAQQLDALTVGKMWRMGDNYWSLLDTNLPITFGGIEINPGLYYLAVRRSADGARWEMVFIDPALSRKKGLDAYDVGTRPAEIPILFSAPLALEQSGEVVERLTLLLKLDPDSQTDGSLRLTWGSLALTAPVRVRLPESGG